jgi:SAM-dependent methyltransferase
VRILQPILSARQQHQDDEYVFPYHYLPRYTDGRFSHLRYADWGLFGLEYISYILFVLKSLETMSFRSLVDIGCGDGRLLNEISLRFPHADLLGIDISQRAIYYAMAFNPDVEFLCTDISDPGHIPPRLYDVVTLIDTLEHIPHIRIHSFATSLANHLSHQGTLIVTVPTTNIPLSRKHYAHYSLQSLDACLSPHFEIYHHVFLCKLTRLRAILRRALVNNIFALNQRYLLDLVFRVYQRTILFAAESNAKAICVFCRKAKTK